MFVFIIITLLRHEQKYSAVLGFFQRFLSVYRNLRQSENRWSKNVFDCTGMKNFAHVKISSLVQ